MKSSLFFRCCAGIANTASPDRKKYMKKCTTLSMCGIGCVFGKSLAGIRHKTKMIKDQKMHSPRVIRK